MSSKNKITIIKDDITKLDIKMTKLKIKDYKKYENEIIKIQSCFRGYNFRKNNLPNVLYRIKNYLIKKNIKACETSKDGIINSCIDEIIIIDVIEQNKKFKIVKPDVRNWYDILIYDYVFGWIPVNIKTTTMTTSDNTGNYTMCVYSYTDEKLDLHKTYQNGKMTDILIDKLKNKKFNINYKKDYFFIVVNKTNTKNIIINSVKGLNILTSNINNLPFQVKWKRNKEYEYKNIKLVLQKFLDTQQGPKPSWKENYLSKIRNIKI
jgi:hypothetical protein